MGTLVARKILHICKINEMYRNAMRLQESHCLYVPISLLQTKENTALYTAYNKNDQLGCLKEVCLTVFFSRMNEMNTCYLQKVLSNVVQINVNRQDINYLGANVDD